MVATKDLADQCRNLIVSNQAKFENLAQTLSLCQETKTNRGESGWIDIDQTKTSSSTQPVQSISPQSFDITNADDLNKLGNIAENAKEIFSSVPMEVVNSAIFMNKGDISVVKSFGREQHPNQEGQEPDELKAYWHVVQLLDIETKLSPSVIKKRKENFLNLKGMTSSENGDKPLTYFMETMGCQMNVADSERMQV